MTSQMGIRLTDEQLSDLDEIAGTQHNTRSGIIRLAIDQFREAFHREHPAGGPELCTATETSQS